MRRDHGYPARQECLPMADSQRAFRKPVVVDDDVAVAARHGSARGLGRWAVRLLACLGVLLMVLGATGWWLTTRVLSADGFGDVVAKASQRQEVRDYIADQATLRLARTSNFVSAARPIVTDALAAGDQHRRPSPRRSTTSPNAPTSRSSAASDARRVNVDSAEAAITVRSALETINPALANKLPPNVLSATTTHLAVEHASTSCSGASKWIRTLYIPVFLAGRR